MKNKEIIIHRLNRSAQDPKKISSNIFEFYADKDHEIINKKNNIIHSGFYLSGLNYMVTPSNIYLKYDCIPYSYQTSQSEISINAYCYSKNNSDKHFATRYKILPKGSCILYITIVSSSYEENYNLNIIDR
jgi:hypothetical protein